MKRQWKDSRKRKQKFKKRKKNGIKKTRLIKHIKGEKNNMEKNGTR